MGGDGGALVRRVEFDNVAADDLAAVVAEQFQPAIADVEQHAVRIGGVQHGGRAGVELAQLGLAALELVHGRVAFGHFMRQAVVQNAQLAGGGQGQGAGN